MTAIADGKRKFALETFPMCAAEKSLKQVPIRQALDRIILRTRKLLGDSAARVTLARELCDTSRDLLQQNADFRDFLRENRLIGFCRYEQLRDRRKTPKTP